MGFLGFDNPYTTTAFYKAQDDERVQRLAVARAFNEWRASNPNAGYDEMKNFLSVAAGGDPSMAGAVGSDRYLKGLADEAARQKAATMRDQYLRQMDQDALHRRAFESKFQEVLPTYGFDHDKAWEATQGFFKPTIQDAGVMEAYDGYIKNLGFDPKALAAKTKSDKIRDNGEFISKALIETKGDWNAAAPVINRALGFEVDRDDPIVSYAMSIADRENKARDFQEKQHQYTLQTQSQAQEDRLRSIAGDIFGKIQAAPTLDMASLKAMYPELADAEQSKKIVGYVQSLQRGAFDAGNRQWEATLPGLVQQAGEKQVKELGLDSMATGRGALVKNPFVAHIANNIARDYYLTSDQKAALQTFLATDGVKLDPKDADKKIKEVLLKAGPLHEMGQTLRTINERTRAKDQPRTLAEHVATEDQDYGQLATTLTGQLKALDKLPQDQQFAALANIERQLPTDAGINSDYSSLHPTVFGDTSSVDLAGAAAKTRQTFAALRDQVAAKKAALGPAQVTASSAGRTSLAGGGQGYRPTDSMGRTIGPIFGTPSDPLKNPLATTLGEVFSPPQE